MSKRFIYWLFAGSAALTLAIAIVPAFAFSPQELLAERTLGKPECKEGVCTIKEDDLRWLLGRAVLLERIASNLYDRLKGCSGARES